MLTRSYKTSQAAAPGRASGTTSRSATPAPPPPTAAAPSAMPASVAEVVSEELAKPTPSAADNVGGAQVEFGAPKEQVKTEAELAQPALVGGFIIKAMPEGGLCIYPNDGTAGQLAQTSKSLDLVLENRANGKQLLIIIADVTKIAADIAAESNNTTAVADESAADSQVEERHEISGE